MSKLIKTESIFAKAFANYSINAYTTNFGAVIFDNSKDGKVSNSFIFHIGFEKFGHIDIYIDKKLRTINSIWFVNLKSHILFHDKNLVYENRSDFKVPFFDTTLWENKEKIWSKLNCEEPIEVYHNGYNMISIVFGIGNHIVPLNSTIQFQYDESEALTGIFIKDEKDIPKLIEKLVK